MTTNCSQLKMLATDGKMRLSYKYLDSNKLDKKKLLKKKIINKMNDWIS